MLNNEFRFIGTVVSEYERIGSDTFPKYTLTIECERKKKGAPSMFKVVVYEKNYSIDITKSVKGKQVIVTGYIDEYKGHLDLIMQDMIVVGAAPAEIEKKVDTVIAHAVEETAVAVAADLPDDDLPF